MPLPSARAPWASAVPWVADGPSALAGTFDRDSSLAGAMSGTVSVSGAQAVREALVGPGPAVRAAAAAAAQRKAAARLRAAQLRAAEVIGSVQLPERGVDQGEWLEPLRHEPAFRCVRDSAIAARGEDGQRRAGLADEPGHPDPLRAGLHPGGLGLAMRGVGHETAYGGY